MHFLAQDAPGGFSFGDFAQLLFEPQVLVFMIPITAIIVGGVLKGLAMLARHRERIAMIQNGFDPDGHAATAEAYSETTAPATASEVYGV